MTEPEKPTTWTIGDLVRWATDDFRSKAIESPRLDAEVLLAHALRTTRIQLIVDAKRPLEPGELARFRELVKRRRRREPVAYLLGEREFYGRTFAVDKRVLIPRPDTETLVEVALRRSEWCSLSMRALDMCTGTGCVAISLALERPTACVFGSDVSDGALAVARRNRLRLGAYNVSFVQGDLFAAVPARRTSSGQSEAGPATRPRRFDVITANPPYIPSDEISTLSADIRDFEPRLALDGGPDGLSFYRRIVDDSRAYLALGGIVATEVGAGLAPAVASLFDQYGFTDVETTKDYGRIDRVVSGRWADAPVASSLDPSKPLEDAGG